MCRVIAITPDPLNEAAVYTAQSRFLCVNGHSSCSSKKKARHCKGLACTLCEADLYFYTVCEVTLVPKEHCTLAQDMCHNSNRFMSLLHLVIPSLQSGPSHENTTPLRQKIVRLSWRDHMIGLGSQFL